MGFPDSILLGQEAQGFAHDLALVVVETRSDLALNECLELWGEVDVHGVTLGWLSKIVNPCLSAGYGSVLTARIDPAMADELEPRAFGELDGAGGLEAQAREQRGGGPVLAVRARDEALDAARRRPTRSRPTALHGRGRGGAGRERRRRRGVRSPCSSPRSQRGARRSRRSGLRARGPSAGSCRGSLRGAGGRWRAGRRSGQRAALADERVRRRVAQELRVARGVGERERAELEPLGRRAAAGGLAEEAPRRIQARGGYTPQGAIGNEIASERLVPLGLAGSRNQACM